MDRDTAFKNLTEAEQHCYASPESGELFYSVFEKYVKRPELYKVYIHIIGDAILGFYRTNDIPQKLQTTLELSADDAQRIMSEINEFLAPVISREHGGKPTKQDELRGLEKNFRSLREEALQSALGETTSAATSPVPENLPVAEGTGLRNPIAVAAMAEIGEHTPAPAPVAPTAPSAPAPEVGNDPDLAAAVAEAATNPEKIEKAGIKASYTVEPMHTMQSDITRVHGYGAYRDLFPDEGAEAEHKEETIKAASQSEILNPPPQLAEKPNYSGE